MQHLIIFSVGPVQDFINTARRSRDLWYGSWMLSELARIVAQEVVNAQGKLIFPVNAEIESIPNKIVAKIETNDADTFAKNVKQAVCKHLKEELAKKTINPLPLTDKNKELAYQQIEDLLELYWACAPYNDRSYQDVREQAEVMLIARKNTRNFKQMTGANVPKSSLDGSRESVIDESKYPKNNSNEVDKENAVRDLYEKFRARQGERLSGVDLLKRLGARNNQPEFKSTSHMAAIPFLRRLGSAKDELITDIRDSFGIATWGVGEKDEGALLFENRLIDLMPNRKKQKDWLKLFNEKIKAVTNDDSRPSPYYALIRADGDSMGEVINGQTEESKHRELSKALSEFAGEVKKIINDDHNGLLIFSGGDDVLAYLPVDMALSCAHALEKKFKEKLGEYKTVDGKQASLSVGVVIAHHLDPLSDVLKLAKEAERTAKEGVAGKNGLAVTLSKRSGIDRTIVGKFADLHSRLQQMIDLTKQKIISAGTAYELQEIERILTKDFDADALQKEARRIVEHKQAADGRSLSKEEKETYLKVFDSWTDVIKSTKDYTLHDLANEMIIAKSLADGAESTTNQDKEAKDES